MFVTWSDSDTMWHISHHAALNRPTQRTSTNGAETIPTEFTAGELLENIIIIIWEQKIQLGVACDL